MDPIRYNIYKGVTGKFGAAQITLIKPNIRCPKDSKHRFDSLEEVNGKFLSNALCPVCGATGLYLKEGGIFLEVAKATKANVYDWKSSIKFFMALKDITLILAALPTKGVKILHDPNAGTNNRGSIIKNLEFQVKDASRGALLCLNEKNQDQTKNYMVPLSAEEVLTIILLFRASVPLVLGWN